MAFENLRFDVRDGIAVVTVNRPDKLNALNRKTLEELNRAVDKVEADDGIRVLVVTGAGEKSFVAGADIREINTLGASSGKEFALFGQEIFRRIECLGKPAIAAVNGYALGGGCELAMACHLRVASENAKFGQPEINLGIIPGYGGTQRLTRLVGRAKALELILTGDQIKADHALQLGLVNAVFEAKGFMDT